MNQPTFTNEWFQQTALHIWQEMFNHFHPKNVLEIGSYEGRSTRWLLDNVPSIQRIVCIDTWKGGQEHASIDMQAVQARFDANTKSPKVVKEIGLSHQVLQRLNVFNSLELFDFIYIDGSHEACDVLADSVLAWPLLAENGLMAFDDYLWNDKTHNPLHAPKMGIDAFVSCHRHKLQILNLPTSQLWLRKLRTSPAT